MSDFVVSTLKTYRSIGEKKIIGRSLVEVDQNLNIQGKFVVKLKKKLKSAVCKAIVLDIIIIVMYLRWYGNEIHWRWQSSIYFKALSLYYDFHLGVKSIQHDKVWDIKEDFEIQYWSLQRCYTYMGDRMRRWMHEFRYFTHGRINNYTDKIQGFRWMVTLILDFVLYGTLAKAQPTRKPAKEVVLEPKFWKKPKI